MQNTAYQRYLRSAQAAGFPAMSERDFNASRVDVGAQLDAFGQKMMAVTQKDLEARKKGMVDSGAINLSPFPNAQAAPLPEPAGARSPWLGQNLVMQNQEPVPTPIPNRAPASVSVAPLPPQGVPMNTSLSMKVSAPRGAIAKSPWSNMSEDADLERLNKLQDESIANQKKLLAAHEMNIMNNANFTPLQNLAPLIGLTDTWTGSNLSAAYQAPESASDRVKKVQALELGLAQQQNQITDNQLNQLKTALQEKKADRQFNQQLFMQERALQNARDIAGMRIDASSTNSMPKDHEFKAAGFARRAAAANQILNQLQMSGFDATTMGAQMQDSKFFPDIFMDENNKRYQQAKQDLITASLRDESGATIGTDEFRREEIKLFPQAGDTPAVLAQKAASRERIAKLLEAEGARALPRIQQVQGPGVSSRAPGGVGQGKPWEKQW